MSPSVPDEVFDRGLQQERTLLAWDRTGVSMMVAGAILVRTESESLPLLFAAIGTAAIMLGAWLVFVGNLRYRQLHALLRADGRVARPALVRAVGLSTVVLALAAVARLLAG